MTYKDSILALKPKVYHSLDSDPESCYTFHNDNGKLKVVEKFKSQCTTTNNKHLGVLFNRYFDMFEREDEEALIRLAILEATTKLNMDADRLKESINELYEELLEKYPEKFI